MKDTFFKQYFPEGYIDFSVIIEDDGKVAYAYLLHDNAIVADVWLYNSSAPVYDDWENISEEDLPLQNLESFITEVVKPVESEGDIEVKWEIKANDIKVFIYIYKRLTAILQPDVKPGYNMFVNSNTPVAMKL